MPEAKREFTELSHRIIGCAIAVHRELGPGLIESAYRHCLAYELRSQGMKCELERSLPLRYGNVYLPKAYRLDILVEEQVVVELKAVDKLKHVHRSQTLTYMKLVGAKTGFLINFNVGLLKDGLISLIL